MNDIEKYEFDRVGYLVIRDLLTTGEVSRLAAAVDALEEHAITHAKNQEHAVTSWGLKVRRDNEKNYHAYGAPGVGKTLVIEDFWNASSEFDILLGHPPTLRYMNELIASRATINNSEIRLRYPQNSTESHMGGPIGHKWRYAFTGGSLDCMMARMVYFIHDVGADEGPFSVVPATHKANFPSPYGADPDSEPNMVGLEVKAGDAILFTENLRHGGLTNRSAQTRKTLHVGYGPYWLMSQNIGTLDQPPLVTQATMSRLSEVQRHLFQVRVPAQSLLS